MKLGRYEVVRELGKGAMGVVYLAKDPLIGRLVALKTIRPVAHDDDDEAKEFQQRFIREAQAAGILNHPAIVTVHDIGQDEATGISFIAMEYVEGQNVKDILAQGRTLTFDQIGDLIAQVGEALDFAHSKGIVHRDVKPANIIVLEGNRAKITDFGIAKIASGASNLTSTGQFLGTPNYMAPEQIKGLPVDGRTDIFSLGICLYECLTRRKPFGGDSLTSISYKIVHEPFPPLAEVNPQIPQGYEEVVARCLNKDPAKRYQRAKELSNALRAVLRGERPAAPEPMLAEDTVVTHDRDRVPTIEMPFPQAEDIGVMTRPTTAPGSVPVPATAAAAAPKKSPRVPVAQRVRRTLTNVRTSPLWLRPIPRIILAVVATLLLGSMVYGGVAIARSIAKVPSVDRQAELKRARERQLRVEGNRLLQQGNVREAYKRFDQLNKLAPNSPAVAVTLQKLSAITRQEELTRQQISTAKQKLDQGIALYNEKKYADAIPVLQESFSLNPNDDQAANYLKLAQIEQQKLDAADAARAEVTKARPVTKTSTAATGGPKPIPVPPPTQPAQITTVFNSPFSDGYILVKAGEDVVAHENLWEQTGRIFHKNVPRVVNVTKELIPKDTDVQIWVVVPSQRITEHHVIRHKFQPGSTQKLLVSYDQQSRSFDYQLN